MVATASTIATVGYIFKRMYDDRKVANQAMRDHPRFKRIAKRANFGGKSLTYAIHHGNPQGIGGTYAGAKRNVTSSVGKDPEAFRRAKRAVITMDGEAILAANENEGALSDLVRLQTSGIIDSIGESFAFDAYRDGTGNRGRVSAINGNTVTLTTAGDARNFFLKMTCICDDTATGASPKAGSAIVTGRSVQANTVTFDAVANFTGVLAVNDYLFRDDEPGTCMEGLGVLTPFTAPTAGDSWRGIDRSVDVELLAGCRITDTNLTVEDAIMNGAVACGANSKKQDCYFINPIPFHNMTRRANAQVTYENGGGKLQQGFESAFVSTAYGQVEVVSDPDCPLSFGWGVKHDQEDLRHLGGLPHIAMDDENKFLRETDNDGLETRLRGFVNYFQYTPGCFSVITYGS